MLPDVVANGIDLVLSRLLASVAIWRSGSDWVVGTSVSNSLGFVGFARSNDSRIRFLWLDSSGSG